MGTGDSDQVKELKACLIQLALSTGVWSTTITIQQISSRITDRTESEIRNAAQELDSSFSWIALKGDEIKIENAAAAKKRLKEIRKELYSS